MQNISDIIKGSIKNDVRCQRWVYERYRGYAFKIAFRYIYTQEKAMDVVNDSFVKLFSHFDKFKHIQSADNEKMLLGWLKKIVINTAIDSLRKQQLLPEIGGIADSAFEVSDDYHNADQLALYNSLMILVKKLPPNYRLVFNLYVIDGYSHAEIAAFMNTSISNSKSTLSRARATLQQGIKNLEGEKICRI